MRPGKILGMNAFCFSTKKTVHHIIISSPHRIEIAQLRTFLEKDKDVDILKYERYKHLLSTINNGSSSTETTEKAPNLSPF